MLRVLHLEDDPVDADDILELLRKDGLDVQVNLVDNLADFRRQLQSGIHSLILSDYTIPGMDAFEALRLTRQLRPEVPWIFVSGTLGEDVAINALKMGATDYIVKQRLARLPSAIRRALQEAQEQARRKHAEDALRKSNARLDGIITSAMDAIISMDTEHRIVLFNPAAEKMFGIPASQALGRNLECLMPERYRAEHVQQVAQFAQTGVSARRMGALGTVFGLRANGEEFPIEASISQIEVEGQKVFTVILRDITERRQAEEALRKSQEELAHANADLETKIEKRTAQLAEANANLQTFANTAAHDLRAPLRSIKSFTGLVIADSGAALSSDGKSFLERVMRSSDSMEKLLNDLLEYSRMSQADFRLEPVKLLDAIREAMALLEPDIRSKHAVIAVESPLPEVLGHPATIVLIINNLLSNALKFVPAGTQPQVRIKAETLDRGGHHRVRLWVEDNGIGIRPEDAPKIFGAFQRLHSRERYPGTGLGLAIVRRGAERMGGSAGVESEPSRGSRFWVELENAG